MMTYQQINSTFIPKSKDNNQYLTTYATIDDNIELIKENEELTSKLKKYESKIKELENSLESKRQEMHSYNNLIVELEEEIRELKDRESINDFERVKSLGDDVVNLKDENIKLKEELATQKERSQLLYILILVLVVL